MYTAMRPRETKKQPAIADDCLSNHQRNIVRPAQTGYETQMQALLPKQEPHKSTKFSGFPIPNTAPSTQQLAPLLRTKREYSNTNTTPLNSELTCADEIRIKAARLYLRLQVMGYDFRSTAHEEETTWFDNQTKATYDTDGFIAFAESVLEGTRSHVTPAQFPDVARHFERWAKVSYFIPSDRDLTYWTKARWPRPRLHGEIVPDNNPVRAAVSENTKAVLPGLNTLNTIYSAIPQVMMASGAVVGAMRYGITAASTAEEFFGLFGGQAMAAAMSRRDTRKTLSALQQTYLEDKILSDQTLFFRFMHRFYPGSSYDDAMHIFALCGG